MRLHVGNFFAKTFSSFSWPFTIKYNRQVLEENSTKWMTGSFWFFFSTLFRTHTHTHLFLFDEFVHLYLLECEWECECVASLIQSHNIHSHFGLCYARHGTSFFFLSFILEIIALLCDYFLHYIVFHIPLHFTFLTRIDLFEFVCVCVFCLVWCDTAARARLRFTGNSFFISSFIYVSQWIWWMQSKTACAVFKAKTILRCSY